MREHWTLNKIMKQSKLWNNDKTWSCPALECDMGPMEAPRALEIRPKNDFVTFEEKNNTKALTSPTSRCKKWKMVFSGLIESWLTVYTLYTIIIIILTGPTSPTSRCKKWKIVFSELMESWQPLPSPSPPSPSSSSSSSLSPLEHWPPQHRGAKSEIWYSQGW